MPSAYSANAIAVSVALDSAKMLKGLKGINANLASVGKVGAAAFVGLAAGITKAGFAASEHVMRLELIQNKAQTVFGDQQSLIRSWSQETAASFGLTAINLEGMSAGFADLLIPMEFTRETAAQMTMDVVGLAGAMSEWSNGTRTVEDTTRILARAMLGEREMLKDLGVDIRELDIKQRLMAKGQEELTGNMLKQARATATMELIFERSKDAQAGFANGSDTLIRKTRIMQAGLEEVAQKILLALTPAFKDIVEVINSDFIPFLEEKVEPALVKLAEDFAERLPEAIEMLDDTLRVLKIPVKMLVDGFGLLHDVIVGFGVVMDNPIARAAVLGTAIVALGAAMPFLIAKVIALGVAFTAATGPLGLVAAGIGAVAAVGTIALGFLGKKEKATRKSAEEDVRAAEKQERLNKKLEESTTKFHELARASDKELMPTLEDQRKILEGLDQGYVDFDESFYNAQISADNFANSLKNLTAEQYATAVASEILANSAGQDMIQFDEMYDRAVKNLRMFLSPDQEGSIEALKKQLMKEAGFDTVDYISPGKRNGGSGGSGDAASDFAGYELQTFHTPPDHAIAQKLSKLNMGEVARGMAHFELDLDAFMDPIAKITTNIGKVGRTVRLAKANEIMPGESNTFADAIDNFFVGLQEEFKLPEHAKQSMAQTIKSQAIEQGITEFGSVLRGNLPEIRPSHNIPGEDGFNVAKYLEDHEKKIASETPQNVTIQHNNVTQNISGPVTEDTVGAIAEAAVQSPIFKAPGMQDAVFGAQP